MKRTLKRSQVNVRKFETLEDRRLMTSIANLVGHWTFDDLTSSTAADSAPSPIADNGTLFNGTKKSQNTGLNNAIALDGIDDFVGINSSLEIGREDVSQRTVSLWFYAIDGNSRQVVFEEGGSSAGFNIVIDGGQVHAGAWDTEAAGGSWAGTWLSTEIQTHQWHHIALVLDGTSEIKADAITTYLDGEMFGQGEGTEIRKHTNPIGIGAPNRGTRFPPQTRSANSTFEGFIDEVRIYNASLDANDIQQLAQALLPGSGDPVVPEPIAKYSFEDLNGKTVPDSSTSDSSYTSYNGTLVNDAVVAPYFGADGSLFLDGDGDSVLVSNIGEVGQSRVSEQTISLWFYAIDTAERQVLAHYGSDTSGLTIYLENGQIVAGGWDANTENVWNGTWLNTSVNSNAWNHVALVLDANLDDCDVIGYLNGREFDRGIGHVLDLHSSILRLGGDSTESSSFHGYIDEVQVFDQAVDSDFVNALADVAPFNILVEVGGIQDQIDAAMALGYGQFKIKPGVYETAPAAERLPHVALRRVHDRLIDATDVTLLATELNTGLLISDSVNVTLRGLTIDYDPLPFTQGTVIGFSPDRSYVDVRIHDGYDALRTDFKPRMTIHDRVTRSIKVDTWSRIEASVGQLSSRTFRIYGPPQNDNVQLNDLVSFTKQINTPHAFYLGNTYESSLENVTVNASSSMGIFETGGGENEYINVAVTPGATPTGATQPRLLSSNYDGIHSKNASVGPHISNSLFENMGDDGIAINGDFYLVARDNGKSIVLSQKWAFSNIEVGDVLQSYDTATGQIRQATVLSVSEYIGTDLNFNAIRDTYLPNLIRKERFQSGKQLILDRELNTGVGGIVANMSRIGSGFQITDSTIRTTRARGLMLRSPNGVIESNTIDEAAWGAIVLSPEPANWMEAGFSESIVIRNNSISNSGHIRRINQGTYGGGIAITAPVEWQTIAHSDILIEGNTFDGITGANIIVTDTKDVVVRDNDFLNTHQREGGNGSSLGIDHSALVWLDNTRNVQFVGNHVGSQGPFAGNKFVAKTLGNSNVSGVASGFSLVTTPQNPVPPGQPIPSVPSNPDPVATTEVVVANFRDDFRTDGPAEGWSYLWNAPQNWEATGFSSNWRTGLIGNPDNYVDLISNGVNYTVDGGTNPGQFPVRNLRLGQTGAHPGGGISQNQVGNSLDRYVIVAWSPTESGIYSISDSTITKPQLAGRIELLIHVNDKEPIVSTKVSGVTETLFDTNLGHLNPGDTVYIAIGPDGVDSYDFFKFDFDVTMSVPV